MENQNKTTGIPIASIMIEVPDSEGDYDLHCRAREIIVYRDHHVYCLDESLFDGHYFDNIDQARSWVGAAYRCAIWGYEEI